MKTLHPIQILILQKIMYSDGLKFTQLKPKNVEGNKLTFHLEKLKSEGLLEKSDNLYTLTGKGKEVAGRLDLSDKTVKNQAKVSVLLVCVNINRLEPEYLLYTRYKSPFYKFQGFPTGKVHLGETIIEAAQRELTEETNLNGKAIVNGVLHAKIINTRQKLLEDKIYFICKITNPQGKLISGVEGKYKWVKKSKIKQYLQNPVQEIQDVFEKLADDNFFFQEKVYVVNQF